MAKTMRKKNLKIQILAGSTLMSRFHVGFEIELPLLEENVKFKLMTSVFVIRFLGRKMNVRLP